MGTITEHKACQISLTKLSKRYQKQEVLTEINLKIGRGDAIALLGQNGCGKSTLLKIIGQLIPPSTGQVTSHQKLKMGYVAADFPDSLLTPQIFFRHIMAIDRVEDSQEKLQVLIEKFGIKQMLETPISYLSKGSKQKINVIQALLCQPDVLLLDEPLSGQDIKSQAYFIEVVQELNKQGVTLIMCCHEPFLTGALAKDIYQLEGGRLQLIKQQSVTRKRGLMAVIVLEGLTEAQGNQLKEAQELIQQIHYSTAECRLICQIADTQEVLAVCLSHQHQVRRLTHEFI